MKRKNLGELGERLAQKHLKSKGFQIVGRNFHSRFGEIDLIAIEPETNQSSKTLVFFEVKTRWSQKFGPPEESITPWKIKKMIKTAYFFKNLHPELPESLRLDAVVIDLTPEGRLSRIEVIKNLTQ